MYLQVLQVENDKLILEIMTHFVKMKPNWLLRFQITRVMVCWVSDLTMLRLTTESDPCTCTAALSKNLFGNKFKLEMFISLGIQTRCPQGSEACCWGAVQCWPYPFLLQLLKRPGLPASYGQGQALRRGCLLHKASLSASKTAPRILHGDKALLWWWFQYCVPVIILIVNVD